MSYFDFACVVLDGYVENHIWELVDDKTEGDLFSVSELDYSGEIGTHHKKEIERGYFKKETDFYQQGEWYSMKSSDIHSITFSKDAKVYLRAHTK